MIKIKRDHTVMAQLYHCAIAQDWDPVFDLMDRHHEFVLHSVGYYPEDWLPQWNLLDIAIYHGNIDTLVRFMKVYKDYGMVVRTTNDGVIEKVVYERDFSYLDWLLKNQCISVSHITKKGFSLSNLVFGRCLRTLQPKPWSESRLFSYQSNASQSDSSQSDLRQINSNRSNSNRSNSNQSNSNRSNSNRSNSNRSNSSLSNASPSDLVHVLFDIIDPNHANINSDVENFIDPNHTNINSDVKNFIDPNINPDEVRRTLLSSPYLLMNSMKAYSKPKLKPIEDSDENDNAHDASESMMRSFYKLSLE